jgi:hypothetical protein
MREVCGERRTGCLKSLKKNRRAGDAAAQHEQSIKAKITMAKQSNNNPEQYARELFTCVLRPRGHQ